MLPILAAAQTSPDASPGAPAPAASVIKNAGEPMHVLFTCAEDELQSVGLLCTEEEPCAIFLELNALVTAGKKILVAGDLHASSGTLSSILLSSDDSGATWKEPMARIRGAAIDFLEFYDLDHAWAAGETQYPLPRDPFFAVSTDGGRSWRTRPVTEDGGPGSVQRFWFDSAQHGEAIVDGGKRAPSGRYLSYESETGGDSWTIRATGDQLPKIRRAPPSFDNPDYRLRPNAGAKAYLVERRMEDRGKDVWEPLASFAIDVAACRIRAPELKEPADDTQGREGLSDAPKDYVEELRAGDASNAKTPKAKEPPKKKGPVN